MINITILVDDEKSWFIPYAKKLKTKLEKRKMHVSLIHDQNQAKAGEISFLLSCSKIVGKEFLEKFDHNIVVHASDLPQGKGFTPMKWQILEGKNEIVLTLFEAVEQVDAGPYYMKETIGFDGTELLDAIQKIMGEKIIDMCERYAAEPEKFYAHRQQGEESFYERFSEADDEIDIDRTIREQFNHFRIADNERFPLWFMYQGKKYYIKIYNQEQKEGE